MTELAISVVVPTYNRARLIARALASVLLAVAPGDDVIVVDDGSTDETAQVLKTFGSQIRVVQGPHRGVGAARNRGVAESRRALVAFMDSDDEWHPDKLRLQRAFMVARPDVLFCFSDFGLRGERQPQRPQGLFGWHRDSRSWNEILGPAVPYSSFAPLPAGWADFRVHVGDLYPALLRANYVASQSVLVRRAQAGAALRYPEDISIHEDHECFTRLARAGRAAYFDCETFWQWGHPGPRLTWAADGYRSACAIKVLERTFGADEEFLARHGAEYRQALRAEHVQLAHCLLVEGRPAEARSALRRAGGGPLTYRALATLPRPVLLKTLELRRRLRAKLGRSVATEPARF